MDQIRERSFKSQFSTMETSAFPHMFTQKPSWFRVFSDAVFIWIFTNKNLFNILKYTKLLGLKFRLYLSLISDRVYSDNIANI